MQKLCRKSPLKNDQYYQPLETIRNNYHYKKNENTVELGRKGNNYCELNFIRIAVLNVKILRYDILWKDVLTY